MHLYILYTQIFVTFFEQFGFYFRLSLMSITKQGLLYNESSGTGGLEDLKCHNSYRALCVVTQKRSKTLEMQSLP